MDYTKTIESGRCPICDKQLGLKRDRNSVRHAFTMRLRRRIDLAHSIFKREHYRELFPVGGAKAVKAPPADISELTELLSAHAPHLLAYITSPPPIAT